MFFIRLSYFIRKALSNLRAYPLVTTLATATVAFTVFIFSAYLLFLINITGLLAGVGTTVHLTAYLSDYLEEQQIEEVKRAILSIKEVRDVTFISKEEALAFLKETFQEQADVLEGLDGNPLPASFEVTLAEGDRTPESTRLVADKIGRMRGVDDVVYPREWLTRFHEFARFVQAGGVAVGAVLSLVAVAIIANTFKLIILSRRQEIEIMKLVGATNSLIKTPILMEGMLVGLLGSAAALAGLFALFSYFMQHFYESVSLFVGPVVLAFFSPSIIVAVVGTSTLLGLVGSLLSFGRLLKV
jgi:cell division transport system permease protein